MNFFFDYIYYRAYKAFFKWDGVYGSRAIWIVTMTQSMSLLAMFTFITSSFFGRSVLFPYSKMIGFSLVGLSLALFIVNTRKYNNRYSEFEKKWKDESKTTRMGKGLLVILSFLMPWVAIFVMGMFIFK